MKDPNDIDTARRLLAELAEMAEHASMTRSLRGGEKSAAQAYNRVLATLDASGHAPQGMFEPLATEGAEYGEIGVQCRLLLSVLRDDARPGKGEESLGAVIALAPFLDSADLAQMVRERMGSGIGMPDGFLVALAPFLDSSMLGDLVRRNMKAPPAPPSPPEAPEPKTRIDQGLAELDDRLVRIRDLAQREESDERRSELMESADALEGRVAHYRDLLQPASPEPESPPTTLESLAEELRRPDLTVEDRQRIATKLAELSYAQSVHAIE